MAVHEFYTTVEQNDIIGLVDALATKAGTPYRGVVPSGSTTANIEHNLGTTDVDVTVIRVNDGLQVGVPADRIDADNVELTFAVAPTGGQYRVIVSAGTGTGGGGGGGGGEGGTPDPHAASHASDGTDPVSPASIGAALASHNHSSDYAPLTHASRHATAGADPVSPASIGAATSSHNHDAAYAALSHAHAGADITSGTVPIARIPTGTTGSTVPFGNDSRLSDARTPTSHAASHAAAGADPVSPASIGASATGHNHSADYAPITHASRHATAGADPITPASIGAAGTTHSHSGTDITSGTVAFGRLPTGTSSSQVAIGNHSHGGAVAAHATNHALGGSDPLTPDDIGASPTSHDHSGRIIPAGGDPGQALIKSSADDYDVEWGDVSGGETETPTFGPTVVKPLPPINVTPTPYYWTTSEGAAGNGQSNIVRINASLGTHFRVNYTPGTSGVVATNFPGLQSLIGYGMIMRIANPTDGQSIMIEYRNLSIASAQDLTGMYFEERNWQGGTALVRPGFTPGPGSGEVTNYDVGGMLRESVLWQSTCYYGLLYDARARSNAGAWRLISQVPGYAV